MPTPTQTQPGVALGGLSMGGVAPREPLGMEIAAHCLDASSRSRGASRRLHSGANTPRGGGSSPRLGPRDEVLGDIVTDQQQSYSGRFLHIPRCPEHPEEPAMYFCATCECSCICAECVVQKNGRHRDHEVMRATRAHEALRARAGALMDEAVALEDDFAMVADRLAWRRKDVERAAARGRASVRSAFARVRAQLTDREAELLESLDLYETDSLSRLDHGSSEHTTRLSELRRLQESLRARCRNGGDAVEALNTYSAAKAAIAALREAFRQDDLSNAGPPDDFVGLAGSARAELDLHAEGLASLEEAVASLCERGVEFVPTAPKAPGEHPHQGYRSGISAAERVRLEAASGTPSGGYSSGHSGHGGGHCGHSGHVSHCGYSGHEAAGTSWRSPNIGPGGPVSLPRRGGLWSPRGAEVA